MPPRKKKEEVKEEIPQELEFAEKEFVITHSYTRNEFKFFNLTKTTNGSLYY